MVLNGDAALGGSQTAGGGVVAAQVIAETDVDAVIVLDSQREP